MKILLDLCKLLQWMTPPCPRTSDSKKKPTNNKQSTVPWKRAAAQQANNPYVYMPPANNFPPPPPQVYHVQAQQKPQVIYINSRQVGMGPCPHCNLNAGVIDEKKPGIATWSWCVVGCLLGGVCCFWIPFVVDDCYDHSIRCTSCHRVRQVIRSDFCCCDWAPGCTLRPLISINYKSLYLKLRVSHFHYISPPPALFQCGVARPCCHFNNGRNLTNINYT